MPPPLVSNIKHHDYQFEFPTAIGKWRWVTRLDVSQSNPVYSVLHVVSPYGLLRDMIPIPGEIIGAMSASIDELKANFAPHILLGPPTSLTFIANEGQGFALAQPVPVTNDGVYGSLLGVTLTTSASYVRVTPAAVGNLALNETGQFQVEVDSTSLLATGSPYNSTITIQDPTASNNPVTLPVTVVVNPKATISTSTLLLSFAVTKPLSGSFPAVPTQPFQVTNIGPAGSVLEYDINKLFGTSEWLVSFMPVTGSLTSGQSATITVDVEVPDNMVQGTYTEKLRISGYSSNSYLDVQIQLVIS